MRFLGLLLLPFALGAAPGQAESPFQVSPSLRREADAAWVDVAFTVPANAFLYAVPLTFELSGESSPVDFLLPARQTVNDKFSGEEKQVFAASFVARHRLPSTNGSRLSLTVRLQGCDDANCYFPEERRFAIFPDGTVESSTSDRSQALTGAAPGWKELADDFEIRARASGYVGEGRLLELLDGAEPSAEGDSARGQATGGWGLVATLGLILLGGLGLNLTPCVLPMIPVNLAIIGAGAQAGSRRRGFALGGAYGAGMALSYGALGAIVVLTGSRFGTLNASPWFNLAIALIFGVLALGMFDVLFIDLSRFQGRRGGAPGPGKGRVLMAASMGSVAALLAGACVAPVVISVLVQATALYNRGALAGLSLPFVLGIGMGLPWPFAGAGLSFLPKPGGWMTRVKYGFGLLIVLFAGYYALLAFALFRSAASPMPVASAGRDGGPTSSAECETLTRVLDQARSEGRPVFIDFWASWCKNCSAMEHSTFKAAAVRRRLDSFLQVKFRAERLDQANTKAVLDYFGVLGLPTIVVLQPRAPAPSGGASRAGGVSSSGADEPRSRGGAVPSVTASTPP